MAEVIRETHREFAKSNALFKTACGLAKIPATRRQAAKWRDGCGKARQFKADAQSLCGQPEESKAA